MFLAFPYRIDLAGRTATVDLPAYVAGLVATTLLTAQGERVNRPTFGASMQQFVFAPADGQIVSTAQTMLHTALVQWLGDIIRVESLTVGADGDELIVQLTYAIHPSQEMMTQVVRSGMGAA